MNRTVTAALVFLAVGCGTRTYYDPETGEPVLRSKTFLLRSQVETVKVTPSGLTISKGAQEGDAAMVEAVAKAAAAGAVQGFKAANGIP